MVPSQLCRHSTNRLFVLTVFFIFWIEWILEPNNNTIQSLYILSNVWIVCFMSFLKIKINRVFTDQLYWIACRIHFWHNFLLKIKYLLKIDIVIILKLFNKSICFSNMACGKNCLLKMLGWWKGSEKNCIKLFQICKTNISSGRCVVSCLSLYAPILTATVNVIKGHMWKQTISNCFESSR